VRKAIPPDMPLFLRISSTDTMEDTELDKTLGSWDVESTIRVARELPALGVDLLDISSDGNNPGQLFDGVNVIDFYVNIAGRIRDTIHVEGLELLIGAVCMISRQQIRPRKSCNSPRRAQMRKVW
ncbi:hypothetical protein UA08_02513, partial [Talaromyces atroroseus]